MENQKDRTNEENINNQGLHMKILNYRKYNDIDVIFDDGYINKHKTYQNFKNGQIKNENFPLRQKEDLTGKKFGKLTVIEKIKNEKDKWLCKCDCGKEKITKYNYLIKGITKSCGCLKKEEINKKFILNENDENTLYNKFPNLIKEWNFKKNIDISPYKIPYASHKKVWWKCINGHEWEARIEDRSINKSKCPYCSGKLVITGINDFLTLNPQFKNNIIDFKDAISSSSYSTKKNIFKCSKCGYIKETTYASLTNNKKFSCPICSNKNSYNEKFIINLLQQLNVNFEREKTFNWSQNKRYDFYIPSLSCIIETMGLQHYEDCTWTKAEYQQENDKLKEKLAKENGIKHYIVLDCRKSEMEWIKNSILNNKDFINIFNCNKIDFLECDKSANSSTIIEVIKYYNSNKNCTLKEISEKYKISKGTVGRYLKIGNNINLCNYNWIINQIKSYPRGKKVICVETGEKFNSLIECAKFINGNRNSLSNAIKNNKEYKNKHFKFIEKEDK